MAKYEYTVKYNGRKYYPGEEVPIDEKPEEVAVAEMVTATETVKEELPEVKPEKKSKGKKPKA